MTASNILENTLSTLTGLKLEMLFLLSVPLSTGETAAILVASGNNVMAEPVSTAGQYRKTATTKVKTNSNLKKENLLLHGKS